MFVLGEIRTGLLQNSRALPSSVVAELLRLVLGERVRRSERPIAQAISPKRLTAIDCPLPSASNTRYRAVGTVSARAVVTGGRTLQGSAYARVRRGTNNHRLAWSHYLHNPGILETIGKFGASDVADGFLAETTLRDTLDLGAISKLLITSVQSRPPLDHDITLRTATTRLRWIAQVGDEVGRPGLEFVIVDDTIRTLRLILPAGDVNDVDEVVGFCENLALHDWILKVITDIVERADLESPGSLPPPLRAAVAALVHLWMPGAHVSPALMPLWESLELRPGFSRQWEATVTRVRDQLMLTMLMALNRS